MKKQKKNRIELIDALRGLAIVLMIIHHLFYDLVTFLNVPDRLFENVVFDTIHYVVSIMFIMLCGVSSRFSKSNLKRGIVTLAAAMIISAVTFVIDMPIIFGVLHLLAVCMIFYGLTGKLWEKIPRVIMPIITIAGGIISYWCVNNISIESEHLWIFGWTYKGFVSFDYFPLLPWIFVFLSGTWLGYYIKENKFPDWFYSVKVPVLPAIGRHSLIIYMVHQPLLYVLTMLIKLCISAF